jgi:thiamine-monophosphate kinase
VSRDGAAAAGPSAPGLGEFELIRRYFVRDGGSGSAGVALGIGDDCALLAPTGGDTLAVSTDMLVEGRHFFPDVDPEALGHKALAVNLSDLAAMGAAPVGFTLALAIPAAEPRWLRGFADGLFALADRHGCPLVGGDTTRGPLNLCITVFGRVPPGAALRRDRARAGDDLWVSGAIGAAAWAVAVRRDAGCWTDADPAERRARVRLERPEPRLALGVALRAEAHAAIDLSDGLAGDLGHLLERSSDACGEGLGATIEAAALPIDDALRALTQARRLEYALHGGDDYELLFTAPAGTRAAIDAIGRACGLVLSRIGRIDARAGTRLAHPDGRLETVHARSFDHFR